MTQQKESVVTPDRFKSGLTYDEYVARIQRNREKFEYNYRETKLSNEDASAFRRAVRGDALLPTSGSTGRSIRDRMTCLSNQTVAWGNHRCSGSA